MSAFRTWLNEQCSNYVLWPEPEMAAARVAFEGGISVATAAERKAAAARCWEALKLHASELPARIALDIYNAVKEAGDE